MIKLIFYNNVLRPIFLIFFCFFLKLTLDAQLNTFYEDWQPRHFVTPSITDLQQETSNPVTVSVNVNSSNIISQILPSHFGMSLTHFLGGSILNQTDFMSHLNQLGPTILRYPGGNGSNQFFWDGNVPSSILNDSQFTVNDLIDGDSWRLSPSDFKDVLDNTGGEGIIAVNASYARYGVSTNPVQTAAGYAADFVRYMNQSLSAGIKYWEVGNENYGSWQAGYIVNGDTIDGTKYGDIFNVFADSMKAADPNIKIGAVIFPIDGNYNNWTKKVLPKVQNSADFLIIHDYFKRKINPNNVNYQEMQNSLVEVSQDVNNVNNMVNNYTSKPSGYFPIAMTEFNSKTGEREIAMANAIFIARAIGEQIKNGLGMSLLWSFQNGLDSYGGDHGMIARNSPVVNDNTPRPVYFVYHYLQKFMGDQMVWSYSSDSSVSSYASTFSNDAKSIVLINSSSFSKTVEINMSSGGVYDNFYWYELYANNEIDKKVFINGLTTTSLEGGPENYLSIGAYYRPVNGNFKFDIKPYSVYFISNSNDLTSINNIVSNNKYFHNPFKNEIRISSDKNISDICIYDINGKIIKKSNSVRIDTEKLSSGTYLISFKEGLKQIVIKATKL